MWTERLRNGTWLIRTGVLFAAAMMGHAEVLWPPADGLIHVTRHMGWLFQGYRVRAGSGQILSADAVAPGVGPEVTRLPLPR